MWNDCYPTEYALIDYLDSLYSKTQTEFYFSSYRDDVTAIRKIGILVKRISVLNNPK